MIKELLKELKHNPDKFSFIEGDKLGDYCRSNDLKYLITKEGKILHPYIEKITRRQRRKLDRYLGNILYWDILKLLKTKNKL